MLAHQHFCNNHSCIIIFILILKNISSSLAWLSRKKWNAEYLTKNLSSSHTRHHYDMPCVSSTSVNSKKKEGKKYKCYEKNKKRHKSKLCHDNFSLSFLQTPLRLPFSSSIFALNYLYFMPRRRLTVCNHSHKKSTLAQHTWAGKKLLMHAHLKIYNAIIVSPVDIIIRAKKGY